MADAGQDIKIDAPDVTGSRGPNDLVVWLEGQPDNSKTEYEREKKIGLIPLEIDSTG